MSLTSHFGITFSHTECLYLGIPVLDAWKEALTLPFKSYRLCSYWNVIQPEQKTWNDSLITSLLQNLEVSGKTCILTLGQKSPRWPEYHEPEWVKKLTLEEKEKAQHNYLIKLITCLKKFSCITHWQVENEPLDPSGPHKQKIMLQNLSKEVNLVRSLDTRPIVGTIWGNTLQLRNNIPKIEKLYDIIGLHFYFRTPLLPKLYIGPLDSIKSIKKTIDTCKMPVWITELQAEPWEYFHPENKSKEETESMSASRITNHVKYILPLNCERVYFWGYEYWYYRLLHNDKSYWNAIRLIL